MVDAVGHHVADERRAAIRLGVLVGRVEADAADPCRAVIGVHHLGAKSQAVVGLAEAGVISPSRELIERLAVAVARIQVVERVERQAERVDLSVGEILGMRAVGPHPVGVARVHADRLAGRCPCTFESFE